MTLCMQRRRCDNSECEHQHTISFVQCNGGDYLHYGLCLSSSLLEGIHRGRGGGSLVGGGYSSFHHKWSFWKKKEKANGNHILKRSTGLKHNYLQFYDVMKVHLHHQARDIVFNSSILSHRITNLFIGTPVSQTEIAYGIHPHPLMVADFQRDQRQESQLFQILRSQHTYVLPDNQKQIVSNSSALTNDGLSTSSWFDNLTPAGSLISVFGRNDTENPRSEEEVNLHAYFTTTSNENRGERRITVYRLTTCEMLPA
ncbi:hypothetical protein YC2023_112386 [Brassica napus]